VIQLFLVVLIFHDGYIGQIQSTYSLVLQVIWLTLIIMAATVYIQTV